MHTSERMASTDNKENILMYIKAILRLHKWCRTMHSPYDRNLQPLGTAIYDLHTQSDQHGTAHEEIWDRVKNLATVTVTDPV